MPRSIASLLLALFSFALIAPAFGTSADSRLPECCRRAGKHHCAMSSDTGHSAPGVVFTSVRDRCPLYPQKTAPSHENVFVPQAGLNPALVAATADVAGDPVRVAARIRWTRFTRGPPTLS